MSAFPDVILNIVAVFWVRVRVLCKELRCSLLEGYQCTSYNVNQSGAVELFTLERESASRGSAMRGSTVYRKHDCTHVDHNQPDHLKN